MLTANTHLPYTHLPYSPPILTSSDSGPLQNRAYVSVISLSPTPYHLLPRTKQEIWNQRRESP